MITRSEIEFLEELAARATQGPWMIDIRYSKSEVSDGTDVTLPEGKCWCCSDENTHVDEMIEGGRRYHIHQHQESTPGRTGFKISSAARFSSVVGKEGVLNQDDAEFMVEARRLVPQLCDALKQLLGDPDDEQVPGSGGDGGAEEPGG